MTRSMDLLIAKTKTEVVWDNPGIGSYEKPHHRYGYDYVTKKSAIDTAELMGIERVWKIVFPSHPDRDKNVFFRAQNEDPKLQMIFDYTWVGDE